mgnify:CR=1 FL=1
MPKKKTALTIEERLQQALVPAEEQPYEVPENWVWVRLGSFIDLLRGVSYKKHDVHNEKMENDCLILRGGNIIEGGLDLNADNVYVDKSLVSEAQLIRRNDIIIVSSTGSVKVIGRAGLAFCDYNDVAFGAFLTLARPKNRCNKSFVDLFFQSFLYRQRIRELASGVNINNIRSEYITNMQFPLPPLSEQQRIVERIEELFAKLDEAKERLQDVAENFAVRKAAILHKAFTGELTKQWRRENGVSDESWEDASLDSVCKSIYDGDHMPPPKSETGIPFLVISNVNTGFISFEKCRFVPEEYYDALSETRTPEMGDILYTIVGSYGIPVMVDTDKKFCFQRHMALLKPSNIYNRFLWRQLQTQSFFEQATSIATGTAQLTVPIKGLRKLIVKCPSLPEQHEIVRLIDDLLARERAAQQAAEQALASIDLMKKSILARAFRGELGTNKASEASALELLRQVLAEN